MLGPGREELLGERTVTLIARSHLLDGRVDHRGPECRLGIGVTDHTLGIDLLRVARILNCLQSAGVCALLSERIDDELGPVCLTGRRIPNLKGRPIQLSRNGDVRVICALCCHRILPGAVVAITGDVRPCLCRRDNTHGGADQYCRKGGNEQSRSRGDAIHGAVLTVGARPTVARRL